MSNVFRTSVSQNVSQIDHSSYRPDVDGLRALAIGGVVIFHAFPQALSGGYVGVDVFFVISGFLISGIIFQAQDGGRFSFAHFYVRRIRRIFPALLLTLLLCLMLGYVIFLPYEFRQLQHDLAAAALFVSNIMTWNEVGYFDLAAEKKPLLHLWSLGIEEQFYLVWPLIVVVLGRLRVKLLPIIVGFAVASFALNVGRIADHPTGTFYLPPGRFWELMLGAMGAALYGEGGTRIQRAIRARKDLISVLGLVAIASSFVFIDAHSRFPGWWALLPAGGTLALILSGPDALPNRTILSWRPVIFVGLISYPLYLFHWPLLVFSRLLGIDEPAELLAVVGVGIALAVLTYRYVETPIRRQKAISAPALAALVVFVPVFGFIMPVPEGLDRLQVIRGPEAEANCIDQIETVLKKIKYCKVSAGKGRSVLVLGDSHGQAIYDGITGYMKNASVRVEFLGDSGCPPALNMTIYSILRRDEAARCQSVWAAFFDYARKYNPDLIVLVGRGAVYLGNDYVVERSGTENKDDAFFLGTRDAIAKASSIAPTVYILENPEFPNDPADCIRPNRFRSNLCRFDISAKKALGSQSVYRRMISQIGEEFPKLAIIDCFPIFCGTEVCSQLSRDNQILYADNNHLSPLGGLKVAESAHFAPLLDKLKIGP